MGIREIILLVSSKNLTKKAASGYICGPVSSGKFTEVVSWDLEIIVRVLLMGLRCLRGWS